MEFKLNNIIITNSKIKYMFLLWDGFINKII